MREQIINFKDQFPAGIRAARNVRPDCKDKKIIIAGIGGSMISGEILSVIDPAVILNRDYDLPAGTAKNSLLVCISWSGDTEETISAYNAGLKLGLDIVVIASGGKLKEIALKDDVPLVLLPAVKIPPRFAVGYMTAVLLAILGLEKELDFSLDALPLESEAKTLAQEIGKKIPLIYASYPNRHLALFWKILFNENAKSHAFSNNFPSLSHNEIAAFNKEQKDKFFVIVFKDPADDKRHNRDIDAAIAIFKEIGYNYKTVNLSGKTLLTRLFSNYVLGLWTSFYVSNIIGVDPVSTELIDKFKNMKKMS